MIPNDLIIIDTSTGKTWILCDKLSWSFSCTELFASISDTNYVLYDTLYFDHVRRSTANLLFSNTT